MKEIVPANMFHVSRLVQLRDGIQNVKNMEAIMKSNNCDVVFIGSEDNEIQIDRAFIKAVKGGLGGVFRELKAEGLGDVVKEIIETNKDIFKT